jgi:hypothetical protein
MFEKYKMFPKKSNNFRTLQESARTGEIDCNALPHSAIFSPRCGSDGVKVSSGWSNLCDLPGVWCLMEKTKVRTRVRNVVSESDGRNDRQFCYATVHWSGECRLEYE